MTYESVLTAIHSRKQFSSVASLERMTRLLNRLGDPQERFRCIHVAGTNGKGSVCALVESALREAGFRVGLFTSPYLVDFRERIQINRECISQERLMDCYVTVMAEETALEQAGFEPINEFELVTALGFVAFAAEQVDYAVIEVGLGGRYDATNVIARPEVCCITPISLDHTAVLGNTLAEIATEKAGIIKHGCPVVLARQESEARKVLMEQAASQQSPVVETADCKRFRYGVTGQRFLYQGTEISIPLLGRYQMDNAAAAYEVCRLLEIPWKAIQDGFARVFWPGRLQYMDGKPGLLIDAGHNPAGITALCETLDELFPKRDIIAVMAMMRDKDHQRCVPLIASRCKALIAATVGLPRSRPPEELAAEAELYCKTWTAASVTEGLSVARTQAAENDLILVCGSVYAAGEALSLSGQIG